MSQLPDFLNMIKFKMLALKIREKLFHKIAGQKAANFPYQIGVFPYKMVLLLQIISESVGFSFGRKDKLKRHMDTVHSDAKPFK